MNLENGTNVESDSSEGNFNVEFSTALRDFAIAEDIIENSQYFDDTDHDGQPIYDQSTKEQIRNRRSKALMQMVDLAVKKLGDSDNKKECLDEIFNAFNKLSKEIGNEISDIDILGEHTKLTFAKTLLLESYNNMR